MSRIFSFLLIFSLFFGTRVVKAAMSSTNYYIYADTVNVGGVLSANGAYSLKDTTGELGGGVSSSSTYQINGGFQYMEIGGLSMSVSNSSLSLGSLISYNASSTASTTVSVNSSAASGFVLSVANVSGTALASVTDGNVDGIVGANTNAEEYGLSVSGTEAAFSDDRAIAPGLVLSQSNFPVDSNIVLTFKAVRNSSTTPGTYSQNISLVASANF